jgi:hypothetical protein
MSITVTCSSCEKRSKAPDDSAGRKIKCPECGAALRVPAADADDAPPRRRKKKRKDKQSNPLLWIAVGGGALLLVAGIVVGVVIAINNASNRAPREHNEENRPPLPVGQVGAPTDGTPGDFNQSKQHLKQLALAMNNYHSERNRFPGAAILSKDGKKTPLLSWRVAILPQIEQQNLYNQFKLDEPWDSAHNKKLIALMPAIYRPIRREHPDGGHTYYQVFTGKVAPFGDGREPRLTDFRDGASNTFLIVEGDRPVVWTKPEDVEYDGPTPDELKDKLKAEYKLKNGQPVTKIGGMFANGFNAVMADGTPIRFDRQIPAWKIHAMITHQGGEVFNLEN